MKKVSNYIFRLIDNKIHVTPEREETIRYGIEIMMYTALSTMGLLLIGVAMNRCIETMIITMVYYLNQTVGGGYHSSTHLKCFLTMSLFLVGGLLVLSIYPPLWVAILVTFFSLSVLFAFPLVLHEHKQYLLSKARTLTTKSRRVIVAELVVGIVLTICWGNSWLRPYAIGMVFSVFSRLVAMVNKIA